MKPFCIKKELNQHIETYVLHNNLKNWSVAIIPSLGARVNRFVIDLGVTKHSIIKGFDTASALESLSIDGYYGAHLFPFPNRIQDGSYTFNNVNYQLPINEGQRNHALHGLIHDQPFEYVSDHITNSSARVSFQYASKTGFQGFPFSFVFTVTYIVDDSGLHLEVTAENTDRKPFPVGYGWHPYLDLDTTIDQLQICVPSDKFLELDKRLIPTGIIGKLDTFSNPNTLRDLKLDTCFVLDTAEKFSETIIHNPLTNVKVSVYQQSGDNELKYVQLFTPETRDCLAVEPMSCPANAFHLDTNATILKAGDTHKWQCGIRVYN